MRSFELNVQCSSKLPHFFLLLARVMGFHLRRVDVLYKIANKWIELTNFYKLNSKVVDDFFEEF